MQVRLTIRNEQDVNTFIHKSVEMVPGFRINPTDIVNRILSEGIQKELKRFERKKP